MERKLSDKQKAILEKNGVDYSNMSYSEASEIIGSILAGRNPPVVPKDPKITTSEHSEVQPDKDRLIVRQSSLKAAVELGVAWKTDNSNEILAMAEAFENWVFR